MGNPHDAEDLTAQVFTEALEGLMAYRGQDSSSVYLVHPDGSGMHLFAENTRAEGIAWSSSGWLGMSSQALDSSQSSMILVKPGECEDYWLPDSLHRELQGLCLP